MGNELKHRAESYAEDDAGEGGLPKRERMVVLGIMMSGTTAACISQSMMIAALPTIMHEFSVNAALGQLLTTAYIFALGLISAMTAFLIRRARSKTLFLAAMSCFVAGCAASLFATNYPLLLASRLLQAGGAGIALPLIQVVALSIYPKSEYGKAMGIVGLIIGFAPAIGPTIAGFLIDAWGWRSVFVVLGAVAIVVIAAAVPFLHDVVGGSGAHDRFDVVSGLLYTAGFVCIMVSATLVEEGGFPWQAALASFAAGGAGLAAFARRQLRIDNPLLKLACFRDRTFAVSTALVLVSQMAFMSGSIMVPLFVQDVQGDSAAISGLTILPGAVLLGILNPITGRYLDRHGPHALIAAGAVVLTVGTFAFSLCTAETPEWAVTALYGVRTVGVACLMMPMTANASVELDLKDIPQGTAIITSFRQIFGALSSSALIGVMAAVSSSALGVDAHGFGASFVLQAVLILAGCAACFALMPRRGRG